MIRRSHPVRVLCIALVTTAVAALVGCSSQPRYSGPRSLTILHTNDIHGKFTTTPATWRDGNPPIGGMANLSAYVVEERAKGPSILVDAGDFMTGNPICDYEVGGVEGGALVDMMNALDYDAICLGNHEFDHGLEALEELAGRIEAPFLCANVYRPRGGLTAGAPYTIVERGGVRVGIVGLMTEDLYGVAAPRMLAGTKVTSMVEEARKAVAAIDDRTDLIVLLTHIGVDGDRQLAREVAGVDVIVGGHSHTRLSDPAVENGVIIVQAGAHNRNLGRLDLVVEQDRVISHTGELIELWPRDGGDPELRSLVARWEAKITEDFGAVIGRLATAWRREYHAESNIGNWLAEQVRVFSEADFGVLNSGGIRKDLSVGPITRLDVQEILPFDNVVTTFGCTGAELMLLARENARAAAFETHGILQIAGLRYRYAVDGDDVELLDVTVGGEPVDPERVYTGASVDYVAVGNAERYLGFVPRRTENLGARVADVIEDAVRKAGTIDARVDGRMTMDARDGMAG